MKEKSWFDGILYEIYQVISSVPVKALYNYAEYQFRLDDAEKRKEKLLSQLEKRQRKELEDFADAVFRYAEESEIMLFAEGLRFGVWFGLFLSNPEKTKLH